MVIPRARVKTFKTLKAQAEESKNSDSAHAYAQTCS